MKLVPFSYEILTPINGNRILQSIELAGRVCYKSEDRITEGSALKFVKMIMDPSRRHESVIEHESISVRIIGNRGLTHELVRHRIASYSQESTRYCNYSKDKHEGQLKIMDCREWLTEAQAAMWEDAMEYAERSYLTLISVGVKPQIARGVLPIDLKTEIVVTANLREWRHIFSMRTAKGAHPHIRTVMRGILRDFREEIPVLFDDVGDLG